MAEDHQQSIHDLLASVDAGLREMPPKNFTDRSNGGVAPTEGHYDFVHLGEKIAMALVQTAESQVIQAQNNLEQTKIWAQGLRDQIMQKDRELAEMNDRLKAFGETVLDAHQKFNSHTGEIK